MQLVPFTALQKCAKQHKLHVQSSICAVWCCSLLETTLIEVGSFVKNSYTRNMGLKFGKLPQKMGELAAGNIYINN